ncbi:MAG: glutaminyl-peptide cyclotransferase [Bacteroidales bacterium]|nr:glutaminyl-peptide cyclotransferase [Bacteroidales bacterium]
MKNKANKNKEAHVYFKFQIRKSLELILIVIIFLFFSCNSDTNKTKKSFKDKISKTKKAKKFVFSINDLKDNYIIGDIIIIELTSIDSLNIIDSVQFTIDDELNSTKLEEKYLINWKTDKANVGNHEILAIVFYNDSLKAHIGETVTLISDIEPKSLKYKVINTFPHDKYAYTQGLIYEDGYLYEGTGQYRESSLRKVDLKSGELLKTFKLPDNVFGEGVTFYNNKIIQLTWKSWLGYVYDKDAFKLLYKFNYPVPIEGWGLTFDGENLIVSDGTQNLMFFDPESFIELKRIEVFDNKGAVMNINELEYINGTIYANLYLTDNIIQIDPKSGKVLALINLSGILNKKFHHKNINVLNGIAYNPENKTLFVTGKYWPKLFEIKLL